MSLLIYKQALMKQYESFVVVRFIAVKLETSISVKSSLCFDMILIDSQSFLKHYEVFFFFLNLFEGLSQKNNEFLRIGYN